MNYSQQILKARKNIKYSHIIAEVKIYTKQLPALVSIGILFIVIVALIGILS